MRADFICLQKKEGMKIPSFFIDICSGNGYNEKESVCSGRFQEKAYIAYFNTDVIPWNGCRDAMFFGWYKVFFKIKR